MRDHPHMSETIVLIGTRKGLVTARSADRRAWTVEPLQFANKDVYAVALDTRRDPPRLFAGVGTGHWGPLLAHSDDLGATWNEPGGGWPTGGGASRRPPVPPPERPPPPT